MNRFLSWRAVGAAILCTALGWATPAGAAVKPLHSFDGDDGRNPATPLLLASDGHWYGTTSLGGANGRGAVYRVAPDGSFGVVHAFTERAGAKDEQRVSGLTEGPDHAFYGSIAPPGIHHGGTLFRVTAEGQYSVLHEFGSFDTREGRNPVGPPVPGPDGNFYGATHSGGLHGLGAVYRMTPAGEVTLIHSFDGTDGVTPNAAPVVSSEGEIFGTTTWGPGGGVGLVYRMGLSGENYSALHAWPTTRKEGVFPTCLVRAPGGDLYGVTVGLVSGPKGNFQGLVFKLTPSGEFSIVHGFRDGSKAGTQPNSHLALDTDGNLYGATYSGGAAGGGTVFRIEPSGHLSVLAALGGDDEAPQRATGGAAPAADGSVWFDTQLGGQGHQGQRGTIVRLAPH